MHLMWWLWILLHYLCCLNAVMSNAVTAESSRQTSQNACSCSNSCCLQYISDIMQNAQKNTYIANNNGDSYRDDGASLNDIIQMLKDNEEVLITSPDCQTEKEKQLEKKIAELTSIIDDQKEIIALQDEEIIELRENMFLYGNLTLLDDLQSPTFRGACETTLAETAALLQTCSNDLTTSQGAVTTLQGQLDTCDGRLRTCSGSLSTCQGSLLTCADSLSDCSSSLGSCNNGASSCQSSLRSCSSSLGSCPSSLSNCQFSLDSCNNANNNCQSRLITCNNNLGTCPGALTACQNSLTTCNNNLNTRTNERDTCTSTLTTRTTERDTCRNDLITRTTERDLCRTDLATRTTERDTCRNDLATRTAELTACRTDLATRTTERDTCRTDLATRTAERDACRRDLATRTTERDTCISNLFDCQRNATEAVETIENLSDAIDNCKSYYEYAVETINQIWEEHHNSNGFISNVIMNRIQHIKKMFNNIGNFISDRFPGLWREQENENSGFYESRNKLVKS